MADQRNRLQKNGTGVEVPQPQQIQAEKLFLAENCASERILTYLF